MPNSVEERIIEKVRKILIADSTVTSYTKGRVYASHISSISEPKYPAVSIHLLSSKSFFANPDMVEVVLQLDSWFIASQSTSVDVLTMHRKIRELLHRQNLIDTSIGLKVAQCVEILAGPMMYEEDTDLNHYPVQYGIVGS